MSISYRGIKYATAERFGHPVPEKDLTSLENLDCSEVICPQPISHHDKYYGTFIEPHEQSEDCLRLSIFTPDENGSYPVLIWIHGGVYITGSSQYIRYDASEFAETEKIVVVGISYRLGMLGFQNGNDLALEDQVCAIEWALRNIHLFGGDNSRVTVMGQSSGAHSVLYHIATQKKALFSKAIIMSAPFIGKSRKSMQRITAKFHAKLPCSPLEASPKQIIKAQYEASRSLIPGMPIAPVFNHITSAGSIMPGLKKVLLMYQQNDAAPFSPKLLIPLFTKLVFGWPAKKYAHNLRKKGVDADVVLRTWGQDSARFGAIHFMEIPLLMGDWNVWKKSPCMDGIPEADYIQESAKFRKQIGDFIKY